MKRPSEMTLGTILLALGAFAGFCLGYFTSNLAPEKLVMQWDIGNTFVGFSTFIVALVSFISIQRNLRQSDESERLKEYNSKRGLLADYLASVQAAQILASNQRIEGKETGQITIPVNLQLQIMQYYAIMSLEFDLKIEIENEILSRAAAIAKIETTSKQKELLDFSAFARNYLLELRMKLTQPS